MSTVGILGAGKLGSTLAQLSTAAGHRTLIAGSGDPSSLELILSVLAPTAIARWASEVAREADIVILALPLGRYRKVPAAELTRKVVVDAMNYWRETDGELHEFEGVPSSPVVADSLPGARVVKAFSHLGYHDLSSDARASGAPDRRALAIAGDDPEAIAQVSELVDSFGFDPVVVGRLQEGRRFEPMTAAFGISLDATELALRIQYAEPARPRS